MDWLKALGCVTSGGTNDHWLPPVAWRVTNGENCKVVKALSLHAMHCCWSGLLKFFKCPTCLFQTLAAVFLARRKDIYYCPVAEICIAFTLWCVPKSCHKLRSTFPGAAPCTISLAVGILRSWGRRSGVFQLHDVCSLASCPSCYFTTPGTGNWWPSDPLSDAGDLFESKG